MESKIPKSRKIPSCKKSWNREDLLYAMFEQVLFFMNHMSMYLYYVLLVFALVLHHFVEIWTEEYLIHMFVIQYIAILLYTQVIIFSLLIPVAFHMFHLKQF